MQCASAQAMPGHKWVFTNGDRKHAERCLRLLGLDDCFEVCRQGWFVCRTRLDDFSLTGVAGLKGRSSAQDMLQGLKVLNLRFRVRISSG